MRRLELLALIVLPALMLLTGCGAQRINFRPTAEQKRLLANQPLDYTVVVRRFPAHSHGGLNPDAYASDLYKILRGAHAFRSVAYDRTGHAPAQLVAESTGDYCNTAIIPLWSIISLGIIPTMWTETECTGVVFRPGATGASAADSVVVHVKQGGKALMGWLALPLGVFPGWTWSSLGSSRGYGEALRLAIIEKQSELETLARR